LVNTKHTSGHILPEQIPVDLVALSDIKSTMERAADAGNKTSKLAIMFARVFKAFSDASDETALLQESVEEKARQILINHNVKSEDFQGFDWDKGVIKVQVK